MSGQAAVAPPRSSCCVPPSQCIPTKQSEASYELACLPAGEPEPLYTKDVPVMSNPSFDATAHHSITLLPDQDISAMLATGGGRCGLDCLQSFYTGLDVPSQSLPYATT